MGTKATQTYLGVTAVCLEATIQPGMPPLEADGVLLRPGDFVVMPNATDLRNRIVWRVEDGRWRPHSQFVDKAVIPAGFTVRVAAGNTMAGAELSLLGRPPLVARQSDLAWTEEPGLDTSEFVRLEGRAGGQRVMGGLGGTLTLAAGTPGEAIACEDPLSTPELRTGDLVMRAPDGSAAWRLVEVPHGILAIDLISGRRMELAVVDPAVAAALRAVGGIFERLRRARDGVRSANRLK